MSQEPDADPNDAYQGKVSSVNEASRKITIAFETEDPDEFDHETYDYDSSLVAWIALAPSEEDEDAIMMAGAGGDEALPPDDDAIMTADAPSKEDKEKPNPALAKLHTQSWRHPHSKVDAPALEDAVGYGVEIDSHEPDALEGDAFPATIHAVNVEKGTVTVSYEVDDGAPPDYQEMDYHSKDIAWSSPPGATKAKHVPEAVHKTFLQACEAGKIEAVKDLLHSYPTQKPAAWMDEHYYTGLMLAAGTGRDEIVDLLLNCYKEGINVNHKL